MRKDFSSLCLHTGDPLHSRALAHSRAPLLTQPCSHCSHSRAPGEQWARLCVFTLHGRVQAARLCRGSPVLHSFEHWRYSSIVPSCLESTMLLQNHWPPAILFFFFLRSRPVMQSYCRNSGEWMHPSTKSHFIFDWSMKKKNDLFRLKLELFSPALQVLPSRLMWWCSQPPTV